MEKRDSSPDFLPQPKKQKQRNDKALLHRFPQAIRYAQSYMHRDYLTHCIVTSTDFLLTISLDGHVKFWKKVNETIEFVKDYKAHQGEIVGCDASTDGLHFITIGADRQLKVFDVVNFDLINIINLDFIPLAVCFVSDTILVTEKDTPFMHEFAKDGTVLEKFNVHSKPVSIVCYNSKYDCIISADIGGTVEYYQPRNPYALPAESWKYKSDTDLYEFRKCKTDISSLVLSPDNDLFVTLSTDWQIRIFKVATGKMIKKYDESLDLIEESQQAGLSLYPMEYKAFNRKFGMEKEIHAGSLQHMNAIFDDTGNFVLYPTMFGIKIVSIHSNKVVRTIGKDENERFMNLALYQGAPRRKGLVTLEMAASANVAVAKAAELDPTIFCTAYRKHRFYIFNNREPEKIEDRDVFNERPQQDLVESKAEQKEVKDLPKSAIMRTTFGDIHIRLFPEYAPKAVENFTTHAKNGYYDCHIFHRVIKKFMVQTGDPNGDGTGGESIWGGSFEDEFHPLLRHDRPYKLSMANAGRNTNGSQFFITVVKTPWLDDKHTIFGEVTKGMEVAHLIEKLITDKKDRPVEDVTISSMEIN